MQGNIHNPSQHVDDDDDDDDRKIVVDVYLIIYFITGIAVSSYL